MERLSHGEAAEAGHRDIEEMISGWSSVGVVQNALSVRISTGDLKFAAEEIAEAPAHTGIALGEEDARVVSD